MDDVYQPVGLTQSLLWLFVSGFQPEYFDSFYSWGDPPVGHGAPSFDMTDCQSVKNVNVLNLMALIAREQGIHS
jgi:hypothetical protein